MSTNVAMVQKGRRVGRSALLVARYSRFFQVQLIPFATSVRVLGVGRRAGEVGQPTATIGLRHASAYEVVVRFADGGEESFTPMDLVPAGSEVGS